MRNTLLTAFEAASLAAAFGREYGELPTGRSCFLAFGMVVDCRSEVARWWWVEKFLGGAAAKH